MVFCGPLLARSMDELLKAAGNTRASADVPAVTAGAGYGLSAAPDLGTGLYVNGRSFQVVAAPGEPVRLEAPACRDMEPAAAALLAWKRGISAAPVTDPACGCADGGCRLDISGALPELVLTTLGTKAGGANCFNTALLGAGLASKLEFTPFFRFSAALKSDCRRVAAPSAGDIGVVNLKDSALSPIHAFIYLTPEFGYEKPGSDRAAPWRFMNPAAEVGGPGAPYSAESADLIYFSCRNAAEQVRN